MDVDVDVDANVVCRLSSLNYEAYERGIREGIQVPKVTKIDPSKPVRLTQRDRKKEMLCCSYAPAVDLSILGSSCSSVCPPFCHSLSQVGPKA